MDGKMEKDGHRFQTWGGALRVCGWTWARSGGEWREMECRGPLGLCTFLATTGAMHSAKFQPA
jgi:hypothetical protein